MNNILQMEKQIRFVRVFDVVICWDILNSFATA